MNESGKLRASARLGGFWIEGLDHVTWVPNAKCRSHSYTLNKPLLLHRELVFALEWLQDDHGNAVRHAHSVRASLPNNTRRDARERAGSGQSTACAAFMQCS
jgi:hypothetical protein